MSQELSQFDQLKADITLFVAPSTQLCVTNVESGQKAIEAAKAIKGFLKRIEDKRKELKAPLLAKAKLIDSYAGDIEAPLLKAEEHIRAQLLAFEQAQEKIRQQKLREEQERQREIERQAAADRAKIEAELAAKRQAELAAVDERSEVAEFFGTEDPDAAATERQALEARLAREEAERQAQFEREAKVREAEAKQKAYEIESGRLKNTKKTWKCEVTDLSKVPREFLIITLNNAAVLAAARGGMTEIPGVRLWQETGLAIGANTSLRLPDGDPGSFNNFNGKR